MAHWTVVVSAERFATERLFANETVELPLPGPAGGPAAGDVVLLVAAGDEPVLFGLGRVRAASASGGGGPVVEYTHRALDEPVALDGPGPAPGVHPIDPGDYEALAGKIGPELRVDVDRREWLVSVDLPIEAPTAAEAVRAFWSYVYELGPGELPAFVSPADDELAMQAFVLGAETNLDPEEDED